MGAAPPHPTMFLKRAPPHLKRKSPQLKNKPHPSIEKWSPLPGNDFKKKNIKNQKLSLIVLHSKNNTKKMPKIPQKHYFLTWSIENWKRKVKQFLRKYIIWLIDLANKLYEVERILISFYAMSFFIKKFCKQTCWIKFNLITYKLTCGCLD